MNALRLECIGDLKFRQMPLPEISLGEILLKVTHCALCRTDAKMWERGQRDMVLPRTLGHEICGISKENGQRFAVYPGNACGNCNYCQTGFENLCPDMQIIGFHKDGGLADYVAVSESSLIPIPDDLSGEVASLSEPLACAINAIQQSQVKQGDRVLIYGAGTVGLLMAMAVKAHNAYPFIKEIRKEKLMRTEKFRYFIGMETISEDAPYEFDVVINAAPSADTFSNGISQLIPRGRFCLFSGLTTEADHSLLTSALNEIHYRQLRVVGAYGCTRDQQEQGLKILAAYQDEVRQLIEGYIRLQDVPSVLPEIVSGNVLKFVVTLNQTGN